MILHSNSSDGCDSVSVNHAVRVVVQKVGSLIATASVAIVVYNVVVNVSGSPVKPIRFHKCLLVTRSQHLTTTHTHNNIG